MLDCLNVQIKLCCPLLLGYVGSFFFGCMLAHREILVRECKRMTIFIEFCWRLRSRGEKLVTVAATATAIKTLYTINFELPGGEKE